MKKAEERRVFRFIAVVLFIGLATNSCGGRLSSETAKALFLKENPTLTVVYLDTGEGWDGVVNYHFDYRKPGDETIHKEVWTFERQEDGDWNVTGRWIQRQ